MPRFCNVKPAEGLLVRDPITKMRIPEEGARVAYSSYWVRQAAQGAVVLELTPDRVPLEEQGPPLEPEPESTNEDELEPSSAEE